MTDFKRKVEAIVRERGGIVGPLQAWQVSGDALTFWDEQQLGLRPTATEIEAAVPYVPLFSPERWVAKFFTPMQVAALQQFEFAHLSAGKPLGPKMTALKAWMSGMLLASADPTPRIFLEPPYAYSEASFEAVSGLQEASDEPA
jgi:hypothetical protein